MIDLFGHRSKSALAAAEARIVALEDALARERDRNEKFHQQLIAMVDAKALRAVEALGAPERPKLPKELQPKPATKIGRLGKTTARFPGIVRDAIRRRAEEQVQ